MMTEIPQGFVVFVLCILGLALIGSVAGLGYCNGRLRECDFYKRRYFQEHIDGGQGPDQAKPQSTEA